MRAVLPPEEGMVFLVLKTLVQRRILMLLMKQLEEEISEVEVGVRHEVSMREDTRSGQDRDGELGRCECA